MIRFKRHLKYADRLKYIDVIPWINIVLLLFIFIFVTNIFAVEPSIAVKLPKTMTSDLIKENNFIITISPENLLYVDGKILTFKELTETLEKTLPKNKAIIIRADRRVSVGRLIEIWNLCRKLEIERINIVTDQPK